jgi:hypothetical protein
VTKGHQKPLSVAFTVKALLKRAPFGLALNDYVAGGPALFAQACAMGLEGIVSKRRNSPNRSGRSPHWLKAKNPENPAARREAFVGQEAPVVSQRAPIITVRDWMGPSDVRESVLLRQRVFVR